MLEPTIDPSVTTGLSEAIESLLPALEEFVRFKDEDLGAREYAHWSSSLNEALPEQGRGAEPTLKVLRDEVIPRGLLKGFKTVIVSLIVCPSTFSRTDVLFRPLQVMRTSRRRRSRRR